MDDELKLIANYYDNGCRMLRNCAARYGKSLDDVASRMESKFRELVSIVIIYKKDR